MQPRAGLAGSIRGAGRDDKNLTFQSREYILTYIKQNIIRRHGEAGAGLVRKSSGPG